MGVGVFVGLPLYHLIEAHVLAAERLHGDDTTVPILAKGKTVTGHIWGYVRDDRPFAGPAPPAAVYYASRDRRGEHPVRHLADFTGILQADAYSGFNGLYEAARKTGADHSRLSAGRTPGGSSSSWPISPRTPGAGRTATAISPIALEAVKRIDALFDIERDDQWPKCRRAPARPPGEECATRGRTRGMAA